MINNEKVRYDNQTNVKSEDDDFMVEFARVQSNLIYVSSFYDLSKINIKDWLKCLFAKY